MAKYITIDSIVESYLLSRQLTVHWYIECLKFATDCYRELYFDTTMGLSRMRVVDLKVDEEGNRYIEFPKDYVDFVSVWRLGHRPGIAGQNILISKVDRLNEKLYLQPCVPIPDCQVILEYMTDGSECDAASRVHPFAQKTIEDYITWKRSANRDHPRSPEALQFFDSLSIFRGRINDLTLEDIEYMRNNRGRLQVDCCDLFNV